MNHIKYRERTEQDNINSIKNIKINPERKDKTIIIPEKPKESIIYWSRKLDKETNGNNDKLIKECLKWPTSTNLLCYNCCNPFEGVPVPIPTLYDDKRNIYFCHGNFCSWQCSKAYNINEMPKAGQGNRNMNIALLAKQMWSNYRDKDPKDKKIYSMPIIPAPRRSELKSFGGNKTIEEYRKGFFGIIPPEEAYESKPFINIKDRLALPFVDRNSSTEIISNSKTSVVNDNSSFSFTKKIETSVIHKHANDFCERLNKAKNEKVIIKRQRKDESKNTLLSSMGVVVKRKK